MGFCGLVFLGFGFVFKDTFTIYCIFLTNTLLTQAEVQKRSYLIWEGKYSKAKLSASQFSGIRYICVQQIEYFSIINETNSL